MIKGQVLLSFWGLCAVCFFSTISLWAQNRPDSDTSCCYVASYPLAPHTPLRTSRIASAFNPVTGDLFVYDGVSSNIYRIEENGTIELHLNYLDIRSEDRFGDMQVSPDGKYLFFTGMFGMDVMVIDIRTKEIILQSTTPPERAMIGASHIVTRDNTMYKMGGYGYWDYRNVLIEWSLQKPYWDAVQINNERPVRGFLPILNYNEDADELHYFVHPTPQNQPNTSFISDLDYFTFDLSSRTWAKQGEYRFAEPIQITTDFHRITPSYTASPALSYLSNTIFFNHIDQNFYKSDLDFFERVKGTAGFYSERLKKRILIAESNTSGSREVYIRLVDEADLNLVPIPLADAEFPIWVTPLLSMAGVLIVGYMVIQFRKKPVNSPDHKPVFTLKRVGDGDSDLFHSEEKIALTDPHMRRLWNLIYEMKSENQSEIYLSDLDQFVFKHSKNAALNSRTRNKLFRVLGEMSYSPFVRLEQSSTDKRYKIVRFDMSQVTIQEG